MSKKRKNFFSKPLCECWEAFHNETRGENIPYEQFFRGIVSSIQSMPFLSDAEKYGHSSLWDLWYSDAKKEMLHIFFEEKELKDFLLGMEMRDFDGIRDFVYENGNEEKGVFGSFRNDVSLQGATARRLDFALHVPHENEKKGFAFRISFITNEIWNFLWTHGEEKGIIDSATYAEKKIDEMSRNMLNFAFNVIAYMKCFPECVKDGVPDKFSDDETDAGVRLEISPKVADAANSKGGAKTARPHFRKGYFKRLRSDFYKEENRGKLIFVSETFVNGRAKTLETAENLSDFAGKQ